MSASDERVRRGISLWDGMDAWRSCRTHRCILYVQIVTNRFKNVENCENICLT